MHGDLMIDRRNIVIPLGFYFLFIGGLIAGAELPALPDLPPLPDLSSSESSGALANSPQLKRDIVLDSAISRNGLDTQILEDDGKDLRGSWFKKRHWLLKSREQQEKINSLVLAIQDVGSPLYDSKRASFDKDILSFYEKIGVEKGQSEGLLELLAPYFDMSFKGKATIASQALEAKLSSSKNYQKYFDTKLLMGQLKSDLQAIADLEDAVISRVDQFEKVTQQALSKVSEAQKIISDIFSMVSHEAARDGYYSLEGITSYLEAVLKFVKNDLASDLDKVISLGKTRMDEVSRVVLGIKAVCDELKKDIVDSDKKLEQPSLDGENRDKILINDQESANNIDRETEIGPNFIEEKSSFIIYAKHFFSWLWAFLFS